MEYIVDTQILIWTLIDPVRLSSNTLSILQKSKIWVSQISLFEIAIKQKINKLPGLNIPMPKVIARLKDDNFDIVSLKDVHIATYSQIPLVANHRDPFDRLIIATALHEQLPLISADEKFRLYSGIIDLIEND